MSVNQGKWGSKIGPRVAMLVSQSMVHTHGKLAALKHKIAMSVFHAISDEISDEVDVTLGPLIAKIHDVIEKEHPSYPAIHFLHTNRGQLKAIAGTGLQVSGLLGSLAAVMNNDLAPVVYSLIAHDPALIPDAGTVSSLAAMSLISQGDAIGTLAKLGYGNDWASGMLTMAQSWPSPPDALEMFRRGLISNDDLNKYLTFNGIPAELTAKYFSLAQQPVSVADAALAVLRGDMSAQDGVAVAAENGFSEASFNILIGNTGEPPGTEQLLEAWRRGFIDEATLDKGILESRVRNEWIPTIKALRFSPMSVADAVNAVVQGHLTMAQGEQIAYYNGLEPGDFDTLYQTAGEPLSRTELEDLYNRGLVDQATVEQGLRESRLKDKYVTAAFELHQKIVPIYTLQRALRYGGVSTADAIRITMESGYSEHDATLIVNSGSAERLQTYKNKVVSSVQSLYEDNLIDQSSASSFIEAMDYTTAEASFILQSSEFRRQAKILDSVVSALKGKYLQRRITQQQVINDLNAVGLPTAQRDQLMALWDIEYTAFTKQLTEAQIVKAVHDDLITPDNGIERLTYMGYSEGDANLLIGGA